MFMSKHRVHRGQFKRDYLSYARCSVITCSAWRECVPIVLDLVPTKYIFCYGNYIFHNHRGITLFHNM